MIITSVKSVTNSLPFVFVVLLLFCYNYHYELLTKKKSKTFVVGTQQHCCCETKRENTVQTAHVIRTVTIFFLRPKKKNLEVFRSQPNQEIDILAVIFLLKKDRYDFTRQ